jgi:hypothetical protein
MGAYAERAALAAKEGTAKSLVPKYHNWDVDKEPVIGKYLSSRSLKGKTNEGTYLQYLFDTDDGRVTFHCGAHFDVNVGSQMGIGGIYQISFMGKKKIDVGTSVNVFDSLEIEPPPKAKHAASAEGASGELIF